MRSIHIKASREYDVLVERGLLDRAGELLREVSAPGMAAIVSDDTVYALYGERTVKALEKAGYRVHSFTFPAGEGSKNLSTYADVLHFLGEHRFSRSDVVVALGGGVIGDLAGFAAATWLRGIRLVQVPTTLLAMVDSSVGGKTAIDLPEGKNLAGAFHQPAAVVCDPQLLDTLPPAILRDGCAEALKTAVLFDPDLFSHLAAHGTDFDRMTVLPRCIACKRDAVCADEFDRGARQLLNLGHTAGHAIETLSGYRIAHGHAVAIGLAIMARVFCRDAAEIEAALIKLGLPTRTEFSPERLAQAALADKKRAGERITLVIPRAIGDCVLREVPVDTLADIFERGM